MKLICRQHTLSYMSRNSALERFANKRLLKRQDAHYCNVAHTPVHYAKFVPYQWTLLDKLVEYSTQYI